MSCLHFLVAVVLLTYTVDSMRLMGTPPRQHRMLSKLPTLIERAEDNFRKANQAVPLTSRIPYAGADLREELSTAKGQHLILNLELDPGTDDLVPPGEDQDARIARAILVLHHYISDLTILLEQAEYLNHESNTGIEMLPIEH